MSFFIEKKLCAKCGKTDIVSKCSTCKKTFCLECFSEHFTPEEYKNQVAQEIISYYPPCYICSGMDHPNYKKFSRYIEKPSQVLTIYDNDGRDHTLHRSCAIALQKKVMQHQLLLLSREKIAMKCYILVRNGLDVYKIPLLEASI